MHASAAAQRVQRIACEESSARRTRGALSAWLGALRAETRANAMHVRAVHAWQRLGALRAMRALRRARERRCASVWRSRTRLQQAGDGAYIPVLGCVPWNATTPPQKDSKRHQCRDHGACAWVSTSTRASLRVRI